MTLYILHNNISVCVATVYACYQWHSQGVPECGSRHQHSSQY